MKYYCLVVSIILIYWIFIFGIYIYCSCFFLDDDYVSYFFVLDLFVFIGDVIWFELKILVC